MRIKSPSSSKLLPILAAAGLWIAPAAAHPPHECRTALANFARHAAIFEEGAKAFEESKAVTRPTLERLFAAWDEVGEADSHAHRHATVYRHFVADFPRLREHLTTEAESSERAIHTTRQAIHWARRAIFCLGRDRPPR